VVAVADGLGGHPGGDIASRCAVDAVADALEGTGGAELVGAAHDRIIARIAEALGERSELIAMATTLTLAGLSPTEPIEVAHVGDSRAYLAKGSNIVQVTDDEHDEQNSRPPPRRAHAPRLGHQAMVVVQCNRQRCLPMSTRPYPALWAA
jgi:protein phosphatase